LVATAKSDPGYTFWERFSRHPNPDQAGDPELNPGSLEAITVQRSGALLVSRARSSAGFILGL